MIASTTSSAPTIRKGIFSFRDPDPIKYNITHNATTNSGKRTKQDGHLGIMSI